MSTPTPVCWELYRCRDRSCPVFGDHIVGNPERMSTAAENVDVWRSGQLGPVSALSCDYFRALRERSRGRRAVDRNLDLFLERALRRLASLQRRVAMLRPMDEGRPDELSLLGQFSQLIPTLGTTDEVSFALLTVITAGQGLGFNRAMLFWRDEEAGRIYGHHAIGPASDREAHRIWEELAEQEPWLDLAELVGRGLHQDRHRASALAGRVRDVAFAADAREPRLAAACCELQELHGDDLDHPVDRRVVEHLDLQHFLTLPLVRQDRSLGFLVVDNRYSGASLEPERVDLLAVLTRFATSILENLILRESLERSLGRAQATMEVLQEIRSRVRQAEKLAASGEMSASLAHEIRNPLTAIGGFSRRLQGSEHLTDEDRRVAAVILEESLRLEEIMGRILQHAQREELQPRPSDLNDEIRDVCHLYRDRMAEAGITLSCTLDPELPRLPLDEKRFRQVMLNLLQNAIEAIEGAGTVTIRTERDENWALVSVADSGCGMDVENQRKVFHAFYTTKRDGTGLGLSLCQRIVRKHGGELAVDSRPGEGTCFTIRLPLERSRERVRAPGGERAS